MLKYASLAKSLLVFVKNGVMSHVACKTALDNLLLIQPSLASRVRQAGTLTIEISHGIRTLLAWYRAYKKGKVRKQMKKHFDEREEAGYLPKHHLRPSLCRISLPGPWKSQTSYQYALCFSFYFASLAVPIHTAGP